MYTLSIPTYNRSSLTIESFLNVLNDDRISEIIIQDDYSDENIFNELNNQITSLNNKKIKVFRNEKNLGAFINKYRSVFNSKNDWIILLDSDNIISVDYINSIENCKNKETLYCPSHAICESPKLDYTNYIGIYNKDDFKRNISSGDDSWDCISNTGNYFFYKQNYLKCVDSEVELLNPHALDAYYLTYLWYKNLQNSYVEVVKGLKYKHRLHGSSYWMNNQYSSNHFQSYLKKEILES